MAIQTNTTQKPLTINNTANINFTKKLDSLNSEFSATAQYGNFISKSLDDITQQLSTGIYPNIQMKRSTGLNNIQIFTGQMDLNKSFNKKWKLETGLKDSYITNNSKINFENYF